jgi:hypothetical protein
VFAEVGVDVAPWLGIGAATTRSSRSSRVERYDTMFRTATGVFDNPRYLRTIARGGAALTLAPITSPSSSTSRTAGSARARCAPRHSIDAVAGFVY